MRLFHFFTIETCVLCHDSADSSGLCAGCLQDLLTLHGDTKHVCPQCFAYSEQAAVCPQCVAEPPPIEKMWASVQYRAPIPAMVHDWKHLRQTALLRAFWTVMAHTPPPWLDEVDGVLAMPVSRERRLMRGFNQSGELAECIAKEYDLPLLPHDAVFRYHRPPQSTLGKAERERNIHQAFKLQCDLVGRNIMLIDDVMTTGNSVYELARTLNEGGARAFVWVLAKNQG